jgi:hypothetical protein
VKTFRHSIFLALIAFTLHCASQNVAAQQRKATSHFQGTWTWEYYARGKAFVPEGVNPKKDPYDGLVLNLRQEGNRLTGKYVNTVRYAAKIEDGDFSTTIKGNVAQIELLNGFGGKVKVTITCRGEKLYWKIIESEGESYFPDRAILHRDR